MADRKVVTGKDWARLLFEAQFIILMRVVVAVVATIYIPWS